MLQVLHNLHYLYLGLGVGLGLVCVTLCNTVGLGVGLGLVCVTLCNTVSVTSVTSVTLSLFRVRGGVRVSVCNTM